MDAGKPKKKRSELELLLGNGDAGGLSAFSPRLPALSISSPAMAEAAVESDEQLARRLHEELNGTRITRRGSKAVTEDGMSPPAVTRGLASPHGKPKAEVTGSTPRAHAGSGRPALPALPSISELAPVAADTGTGAAAEVRAAEAGGGAKGTTAGSGAGAGPAPGPSAEGGGEAVKRKRNSVPARELHLLLQQASAAAGRSEAALSPTRSARAGVLGAARADLSTTGNDTHHSQHHQQGCPPLPRRDLDRSQQNQPAGGSAAAAAPPPPPPLPSGTPPLPPPSLLPPKLKQRYLAGYSGMNPASGSASAAASNDGRKPDGTAARGNGGDGTATVVTPGCVVSGARNSLLSGQSVEGSSGVSHAQSQAQSLSQTRCRGGSGAGGAGMSPKAAAAAAGSGGGGVNAASSAVSLAAGGQRALAGTGASIGGCSSTDETETDNDNSCAAVAGGGDGGPSATSPKASLVPALQLQSPLPPLAVASKKPNDSPLAVAGAAAAATVGQSPEPDMGDEDLESVPRGRAQRQGADGAAVAASPSGPAGKATPGHSVLSGPLKVPKLPMIRAGRGWYRGRLMRESVDCQRVLVDVPGAPNSGNGSSSSPQQQQQQQMFWLPVTSDRIWRGSYKGKDWKYLGDGAWEPKPGAFKRGKQGSSSNGLPLPLPSWAAGGSAGAEAEAEAQPAAAGGSNGAAAPRYGSKGDRCGWSSPDETSDDVDAIEEEPQQLQPQRAEAEGASTRSGGQRSHRRNSPAATATTSGPPVPAVGSGKGAGASAKAAAASNDAKGPGEAAFGDMDAAGSSRRASTGAGAIAAVAEPPKTRHCEFEKAVLRESGAEAVEVKAGTEAAASGAPPLAAAAEAAPPRPGELAALAAPVQLADGGGVREEDEGGAGACARGAAGASASAECGPEANAAHVAKVEDEEGSDGGGHGGGLLGGDFDGDGVAEITWAPGVVHPKKHALRRARRRQQRVRTPLDGLQLPLPHHLAQHNPYALRPVRSDESGGDCDASDAELGGGRRGSGDGAGGTAHHGSRRRAAARAAAVAAAAARAEAEAEEEEQEEILLGRRPPRRDRFHSHLTGGGGAAAVGSNRRNHHHPHNHHRSRSGARAEYYMYGDSSGNLDDPNSGDVANGTAAARPRAGSRGTSQPAPEYVSGAGGGWESGQWQVAGQVNQVEGGVGQAPQAPPRNRRKGKPSRSRMDGEGDAWCYGEDEWELEAAGGAWARMPEVLRRLYYTPCPATSGAMVGGQQQQQHRQQGGELTGHPGPPHRQSGGGAYYGAFQAPNKRRRVYEEDPAVSLDDVDMEMEVDDHEHDADYLPYGGGGSRRSSGFGGGRRCSVNGGGGAAAMKRPRNGDALGHSQQQQQFSSNPYQPYQQLGQYGDVAAQPRRRVLMWDSSGAAAYAAAVTEAVAPGLAGGGGGGSGDGIPAGLAGLLEAALGQDAEAATAAATGTVVPKAVDGGGMLRTAPEVKMEPESGAATATATAAPATAETGAGRLAAPDLAAAAADPSQLQGTSLALLHGDPHGAHVALSDSSAAPSGTEEGKYGGAAAAGTAVDAGGPAACADGAIAASLLQQQQQHLQGGSGGRSSGGGSVTPTGYGISSGGTPPPGLQVGQLRPNTPTRARRTGRPPSAGAPLPKLPALSSNASLRMHLGGIAAPTATAAHTDGQSAGGSGTTAAAPDDVRPMTSIELTNAEPLRPAERQMDVQEPGASDDRRMGQSCMLLAGVAEQGNDVLRNGCHGSGSGCRLWQSTDAGTGNCAGVGPSQDAAAADAAASTAGRAGETGEACVWRFTTCQVGLADAAAAKAAASDIDAAGDLSNCGGARGADVTGCCVMDAIGALVYDNQPAMQQLAMRAQRELDSIGLLVPAQQHPHHHSKQLYANAVHRPYQDELPQAQNHQQRLLLPGRGGAATLRSGSISTAASPTAPDPLLSTLPSVEVVVSLFSARTPFGSAQQALADLVGGATALPLFQ